MFVGCFSAQQMHTAPELGYCMLVNKEYFFTGSCFT